MFETGCAAVLVVDSRIGCACTVEMTRRESIAIEVQMDLVDGDMVD